MAVRVKKYAVNLEYKKKNIENNAQLKTYGVFNKCDYAFKNNLHKKIKNIHYRLNLLWERFQARYLGRVNIALLVCSVTTKCTLRCKNCSNLMQYFQADTHITTAGDDFIRDLSVLLSGVHTIKHLQIMGGEPLIYKDLIKVLEYVKTQRKIQKFYIVTNGTVMPDEAVLKSFKKLGKRFSVIISDYTVNPDLAKRIKIEPLRAALKEHKISFFSKRTFHWITMGGTEDQHHTETENVALYKSCNAICNSLFNGTFQICPRSSMINEFHPEKISPNDIIDLRKAYTKRQIRDELRVFYSTMHCSPCQFCNLFKDRKKCLPGEQ